MSVTTAQATTLLENVLFESATLAKANAAGWATLSNLNSSYSTVSGLASAMAGTAEASIAEQVVRYYEGALGRSPAGTEIQYYVNIAEAGLTASQVAQGATAVSQATWNQIASDFANSPEFSFASASASSVVTLLYLNILGRSPSASEVAYYNGQLASGLGNSILVQEFVNSPEYQTKVNSGLATNLSTFGTAVAGGTTPATIGTVTPPATSYSLTTGVDTLVAAGAGVNTFVGTLDSTAGVATFGGADSVTGVGSNNTLLLTDAVSTDKDVLPVGATINNIQTVTLKTAGNAGSIAATAATFDVSGISGLTSVNVTSSGTNGDQIKAAATTNISDTSLGGGGVTTIGGNNVTISASSAVIVGGASGNPAGAVNVTQSGASVAIDGGTTVTVTDSKMAATNIAIDANVAGTGAIAVTATGTTTGTITVGAGVAGTSVSNAAASTVAVTETASLGAAGVAGAIQVFGGTTDTVTGNIAANSALTTAQTTSVASAGTITGSAITVTGGTATTAVTVNQTAAVAAAAGTAAGTATPAVSAIAAAPGVAGTAGSAAVAASALVPGTIAIADGAVIVDDTSGTIATVTANNFGALTVQGPATALATLNVGGTGGAITVTDTGSTVTTLALNTNGLTNQAGTAGVAFSDSNVYTKINVTATGKSELSSIGDTALKTLTVGGTGSLTVDTFATNTALTSVAVSGSASFSDGGTAATGLDAIAGLTSITTTSSGTFSAYLKDTVQGFTGSAGTDVITVDASLTATKTIAAGSASNNELILDGTTSYAGAASIGAKVTGFQILGVENSTAATLNMATVDATASTLDVISLTNALAVSNLASNAAISIDATTTVALTVGYADGTGLSDTANVTLAKGITVNALTLQDGNSTGIGNVNFTTAGSDTITTLNDTNVTHLSATGGKSLTIGTLTETANATSLSISDTESTGLTIGTLTASTLGSIAFSGTGATTIGSFSPAGTVSILSLADTGAAASITTLSDNSLATVTYSGSGAIAITTLVDTGAAITLNNTGTATESITNLVDANLTNLTLKGNVQVGSAGYVTANAAVVTFTGEGAPVIGATATDYTVTGNTITVGTTVVAAGGTNTLTVNGLTYSAATTGVAATDAANIANFFAGVTDSATGGVTVSGATDNAHVQINLSGTTNGVAGTADTITLGNGNNYISDGSLSGTVNVTVGTGSNVIVLGAATTDTTAVYNVTLGTHTAPDSVSVGTAGSNVALDAPNLIVTGAVAGDTITLAGDVTASTAMVGTGLTAGAGTITATSLTAATSATNAVSLLITAEAATAEHIAVGVYGGNTYIVESNATATASGTNTTIVELMGVHTVSTTAVGTSGLHLLTVAS